jgi:hypothetical protein
MAKAIPPPMAAFPLLTDPFILAAVALLVVAPPVFLFLRGRKPWLSRLRHKPLLTANESRPLRGALYEGMDKRPFSRQWPLRVDGRPLGEWPYRGHLGQRASSLTARDSIIDCSRSVAGYAFRSDHGGDATVDC